MNLLRRLTPLLVVALTVALVPAAGAKPTAHRGHHGAKDFGATTLVLDPAAASALTSLGVVPSPIDPATAGPDGLAFPIVTPLGEALQTRRVRHTGGIALTAGSTRVELTNFTIRLDRRPDLTALVGGQRVSILDLDLSQAGISFSRGTIAIGPVAGSLTQSASDALNGAFGLAPGTVPAGLKLGDATIRYRLFG